MSPTASGTRRRTSTASSSRRRSTRRKRRNVLAAIAVVAVCAVVCLLVFTNSGGSGQYSISDGDRAAAARSSNPTAAPVDPEFAIEPGQLYVPTIGVNANILSMPTEMDPAPFLGNQVVPSFGVPPDLSQTAWWSDGPAIGGPGMAVITGHASGEPDRYAVFNRLLDLKPGDPIVAESPDGSARMEFRVIKVVGQISKSDSTALNRVLSEHPENARLALITCEGPLSNGVGESPDNTVVFAERT